MTTFQQADERTLMTRFDDASTKRVMTRSRTLTLPYRQRSGKRVIRVIGGIMMTRSLFDVVARAHIRARKVINQGNAEMRHGQVP